MKQINNLYNISPEYPRIAHLDKNISNMTHDDILIDVELPFEGYVQEKVDGSNVGVSWLDSAILRNRNKVLKKGYIKKETPAKLPFAGRHCDSDKKDIILFDVNMYKHGFVTPKNF